jgi:hypothetical protein
MSKGTIATGKLLEHQIAVGKTSNTKILKILADNLISRNKMIRAMGDVDYNCYHATMLKFKGKRAVTQEEIQLIVLALKSLGVEVKVDEIGLEVKNFIFT